MTIDAGTTLEFDRRAGLRVNAGTLRATGEAAEPITFTSASREPNDWRGVGIAANTGNVLDHVVIENAGVSWNAINNSTPTNLYVSSVGRVVVTNSAFNNSAGWGIYNSGTITNGDGNSIDPATQGGNTFSGNASGDVGS